MKHSEMSARQKVLHNQVRDRLKDPAIIDLEFTGQRTCWSRVNQGSETIGARFDRTVLVPNLPCSLSALIAAGKAAGYREGFHNYGIQDHLSWAILKGYVRIRI